jgi:hypothetical protein
MNVATPRANEIDEAKTAEKPHRHPHSHMNLIKNGD